MNSKIVKEMDDCSFLDDSKTIDDIFTELDEQYGKTNYGSIKYSRDAMYWVGYLYRCFSYTYEISSKQVYKVLPLKEVISLYVPYHTLDISHAIERILEEKKISFNADDNLRRGFEILKRIRERKRRNSSNIL
ncbi:MAG: antitoxin [Clostridia bacterium]|nr:antitoxin [Clostridia bacterium]